MEPTDAPPRRTRLVLAAFNAGLGVAVLVFTFAATLSVLIGGLLLAGDGGASIGVSARLEPPFAVNLGDGSSIGVEGDDLLRFDEEPSIEVDDVAVGVTVPIPRSEVAARRSAAAALGTLLAIGGFGLLHLRRIVGSARAGDPFTAANVGRLRWLAACSIAVPVVAEAHSRVTGRLFETGVPMTIKGPSTTWWGVSILVALGLLALAEVFRSGVELRELERATV